MPPHSCMQLPVPPLSDSLQSQPEGQTCARFPPPPPPMSSGLTARHSPLTHSAMLRSSRNWIAGHSGCAGQPSESRYSLSLPFCTAAQLSPYEQQPVGTRTQSESLSHEVR